ncbi:MAG: tetratricopeptide repeat protein [Gammaproteobacteria bacterium]|nr:tetratricopeptide repeat protein [Gammaproteobacteria bacterium]
MISNKFNFGPGRRLLLAYGLWIASSPALAQSMQVLGGSSFAKECFELSSTASMTGFASRSDVEVCDRAISYGSLKKKDLVATYVNRGVLQVAIEDYEAAVKDYNRAIELSDDTAEAYVNRGNMWFLVEKYPEAIADYDRALELGLHKAHIAMLNKGMALEGQGRLEEAREQYLAALAIVEDWPMAVRKLERVSNKIKRRQSSNDPE